jgi:PST family polysaccharide transporter
MQLKEAVVSGGSRLLARQFAGIVIGLVGTAGLAWLIGPAEYGIYAAAFAVAFLVFNVADLGIGTYLMCFGQELPAEAEQQAFTLLVALGVAAVIALYAAAVLDPWLPGQSAIMGLFAAGVAIQLMTTVPLAGLERRLEYGLVARAELIGQITLYGVAVPLAWYAAAGAWAPAVGWLAQQCVTCALCYLYNPFRPRWKWHPATMRAIVTYGAAQASAEWIWQVRSLVSTVVVGIIAGPEAVGIVALTQRLVDALSFVRSAAKRMAIPVIGHVRNDTHRLLRVMNQAAVLQIVGNGFLLFLFVLFGPSISTYVFGPKWEPVFDVFPLLAVVALVHCVFNLHSAVLYVLGRGLDVGMFHLAYILLLLIGVHVFVPRFGAVGYGYAELLALPSFCVAYWFLTRQLKARPEYGSHALLACAFAMAVLWPRSIGLLAILALAAQPKNWTVLVDGFHSLRAAK